MILTAASKVKALCRTRFIHMILKDVPKDSFQCHHRCNMTVLGRPAFIYRCRHLYLLQFFVITLVLSGLCMWANVISY